jgi:regulator of sirC expression with transglutaminase-like and TPR domain
MLSSEFIDKFAQVARSPEPDLATAALLIARLEYPRLDASHYLDRLDLMGRAAADRLEHETGENPRRQIAVLNGYLFDEEGFDGNQKHYDDPRNSFLNAVLDRRSGIPVTLALVYMEVARRAGLRFDGVNFPGHFLLRLPNVVGREIGGETDLILDPFRRGAILSDTDCRRLLRDHAGANAVFEPGLLARATKLQILVRMLVNLKRIYVKMRSFPQGRAVTELLLALDPSALTELRDRGLLAYNLNDFPAALRDLEAYLRYTARGDGERPREDAEQAEIWEHVKALRRRVASLN